MKQYNREERNGSNPFLHEELCERLKQETGLEFSARIAQDAPGRTAAIQGEGVEKNALIALRFDGEEGEIELTSVFPAGDVPGILTSRLLAALARQIYTDLLRELKQPAQAWTWEKLLSAAVELHWDETVFEQKEAEYALPKLSLGFPLLIRCQNWHSEVPTVIENLLPRRDVLWVHQQEVFLFVRAEMPNARDLKTGELLVWGEALIQQIHTMLADEVGVLAGVCVGYPTERGLWRGYQEVQRLARLHVRFFPGEAGLAAWKLGLAGLLGEISPEVMQRYRRETLQERLTPELRETLETYFAHSLSISETARALFIHRNTLLYRLDRVAELTGYNPREFAAAVQLYLAIWSQRYEGEY